MDLDYRRLFLLTGLLFIPTLVYADNDANRRITITEARAVYSEPDLGKNSKANEILIVKGHNLCDLRRNRIQVVTLGTKKSSDKLLVKTCIKNVDTTRNLDQLEAIIPENLPPASYLLTINNNVRAGNKDRKYYKNRKIRKKYKGDDRDYDDYDDDFIALFDFTYNSSLQLGLQVETAARIKADEVLHEQLADEASNRKAADESEVFARKSADQALAADLAAEAEARSFSDVILQANLYAEAQTRHIADTAETEARVAADLAEIAAREAADAQEAALRLAADLEETLARVAADESHSADISSNASAIADNASNIERVDSRVDTLEVFVNQLSDRVNTIAISVQGLQTNVQELDSRIQTNELALSNVHLQLDDLGSGLTALTADQESLHVELTALAQTHAFEIANINSELGDINTTLGSLSGEITDFAGQLSSQLASINQNAEQISKLNVDLNTTTTIANANLLSINALESRATDLQTQLDSQSDLLSAIVIQLNSHEEQIISLESLHPNAEYKFSNTAADDIEPEELANFFRSVQVTSSDYIFFEVDLGNNASGAWCSSRADWYINEYLSRYAGSSSARSGAWDKWYRDRGYNWKLTTAALANFYGAYCGAGIGSWCSEWGIGGKRLGVLPNRTDFGELFANGSGIGDLRIRIASTRLAACDF